MSKHSKKKRSAQKRAQKKKQSQGLLQKGKEFFFRIFSVWGKSSKEVVSNSHQEESLKEIPQEKGQSIEEKEHLDIPPQKKEEKKMDNLPLSSEKKSLSQKEKRFLCCQQYGKKALSVFKTFFHLEKNAQGFCSFSRLLLPLKWGVSFLLAGISLFLLWKFHESFLLRSLNLYDEGVTLLGAKRFALGEMPYRDFFTIYAPLKFAFLGHIFSTFGSSIFVERLTLLFVSCSAFATLLLFFWKEGNIFWGIAAVTLVSVFGLLSLTPLLLLLLAFWFSIFLSYPKNSLLPFVGGVLLALLFLLRIDFGGFVGLFLFFILLFLSSQKSARPAFPSFSLLVGKIGLAFSLVVFPVFLWIASEGAWGDFLQQTLIFPLFGDYQNLRHLPWKEFQSFSVEGLTIDLLALSRFFAYFFFFLPLGVGLIFWATRYVQGKIIPTSFAKNLLFLSFLLAALWYASHRSDPGHVLFLNIFALLFLFHLILCFRIRWWGLLFVPVIALVLIAPTHDILAQREEILESEKVTYDFFPQPFPRTPENNDLQRMLHFFQSRPSSEEVYVGISDTSRVFVNNIVLPFLIEQPVATRYHELHTGIVTTNAVQSEMLEELRDVNIVVLWDFFLCEPNESCNSTGVHILDDYIGEHFFLLRNFGKYQIFERKKDEEISL